MQVLSIAKKGCINQKLVLLIERNDITKIKVDAVETAKDYGINEDYSFNYIADSIGNDRVYDSVSKKIFATRKAERFMK